MWSGRTEAQQQLLSSLLGTSKPQVQEALPDCPTLPNPQPYYFLVTGVWELPRKPPTYLPTWMASFSFLQLHVRCQTQACSMNKSLPGAAPRRNLARQPPFKSRSKPSVPSLCGQPALGQGALPRRPDPGKSFQGIALGLGKPRIS